MHPDLSPHLHSADCNQLIKALKKCHADNAFGRFVGVCNSADTLVNRCLHEERIERRSANRLKAIEKQNQYRERLRNNSATE